MKGKEQIQRVGVFPLPSIPFSLPGFAVTRVTSSEAKLVVYASSLQMLALCPSCHQASHRLHSYYQRSPHDLPVSGRRVQLILRVRRFRCLNASCHAATFVEPVADVVARSARRTVRLMAILHVFAIHSGGEPGSRLLEHTGTSISPDTLLRLAKATQTAPLAVPAVLAVDDFAFRRGRMYGTLLLDWERRRPIDLLPDRTAATFASWLRAHPGVQWISRDRSGEYGRGASEGAPSAGQVIDRWHLTKNLREVLERMLHRLSTRLKRRQQASAATPFPRRPKEQSRNERMASHLSRERRKNRYEEVIDLYQQGLPISRIAQQLHLTRMTVYKYVAADGFPEWARRSDAQRSKGILDPYMAYLRQRASQGCRNGQQLFREVREQGYAGSYKTLSRWLQAQGLVPRRYTLREISDDLSVTRQHGAQEPGIREGPLQEPVQMDPSSLVHLDKPLASPRQLSWLLVRNPSDLKAPEQQMLAFIQQEPVVKVSYQLTQDLLAMMKERHFEEVEAWLSVCVECGVAELEGFAIGLQKDLPALQAAFRLPYSNGPIEGAINKLKLIKRSMYGRGSFELLRQRVLQSAVSEAT